MHGQPMSLASALLINSTVILHEIRLIYCDKMHMEKVVWLLKTN